MSFLQIARNRVSRARASSPLFKPHSPTIRHVEDSGDAGCPLLGKSCHPNQNESKHRMVIDLKGTSKETRGEERKGVERKVEVCYHNYKAFARMPFTFYIPINRIRIVGIVLTDIFEN
ncbi:hypothetical protein V1477_006008 [Vespula maculifrons]|uniref:Uncharacterized protein n=1 Tax=Vespula maculifrons TaxID=7453 RepID=A0ABD2CKI8_VESMC